MPRSEFGFIDALRHRLADGHAPNRQLLVAPGDDMAEVATPTKSMLFAADMLMDGVHFDLASCGARLVGRKALAVNLSDVAAMAGTPTAVVVSLALPRGGRVLADDAMSGLCELAAAHGVAVAGGDTNTWDGPLVINVAIVGTPHPRGTVTRGGARPGDVVFVTGALGGSIHSRHLRFSPRVQEAQVIHERYGLTAMVDLSDGLASDLRHVLALSGCGAMLDPAALPVHSDVAPGAARIEHALSDGEDFELCFTLPSDRAARLLADRPLGDALTVTRIGEITSASGLRWRDGSEITARGYVHGL